MSLRARIVVALNLFSVILVACQAVSAQSTSGSSSAEAIRSRFLKIIDRPRVPLDPELRPVEASRGLTATHLTFASESGERVPGIIIRPDKAAARRPAVIVLHG